MLGQIYPKMLNLACSMVLYGLRIYFYSQLDSKTTHENNKQTPYQTTKQLMKTTNRHHARQQTTHENNKQTPCQTTKPHRK